MQGQLFGQDFLRYGIRETPPYQQLSDASFATFRAALEAVFASLAHDAALNEAQTEQLVIEPLLAALSWAGDYLPPVNMSGGRREDVPDMLLFRDAVAKSAAIDEQRDDRRFLPPARDPRSQAWLRALDRGDASEAHDAGAPSSQVLRYLSRADAMSDRAVKWGILTNGGTWWLYWQDARSRAEEFFEFDVAALLGVRGVQVGLDSRQMTAIELAVHNIALE